MADKYQNKYRIPSARLSGWDYGNAAAYFITICTKNRECFFGNIVHSSSTVVEMQCIASLRESDGITSLQEPERNAPPREPRMQLSEIGKIATSEWLKTPQIRPDMNLELGEFVVMPNHFHAIIFIGQNQYNTPKPIGDDGRDCRDAMRGVSTTMHGVSTNPKPNAFAPQSKNLASIMRGYKSAVTKYATINNIDFAWQPRYHDHIIRDDQSLYTISNYIINNPANWKTDEWNR